MGINRKFSSKRKIDFEVRCLKYMVHKGKDSKGISASEDEP